MATSAQPMRLNLHTDFSLRVLMALAVMPPVEQITTQALAQQFGVSGHHLQKVVQTLRRLELVETTQGRGGGLRLAKAARSIRLGALVRSLESSGELVDCSNGPCPLMRGCILKGILNQAEEVFFRHLDEHTLADTVAPPVNERLSAMRMLLVVS